MKKIGIALLSVALASSVMAQSPALDPTPSENGLTEAQVMLPTAVSAGAIAALFVGSFFEFGGEPWFYLGANALAQAPLVVTSPVEGLVVVGASAGFYAGSGALRDSPEGAAFADFAYTGVLQGSMYASYATYRGLRVRAADGLFDDAWRNGTLGRKLFSAWTGMVGFDDRLARDWRPSSFGELFFAPLDPDNWADPVLWEIAAIGFAKPVLTNPWEDSVFARGTAYVGGWELNPFVGVPLMAALFYVESSLVGVAEESHFRGVLYEEAGRRWGGMYAKVFDCLYFPAIHVPQELRFGYEGMAIASNFAARAGSTFLLDLAYDAGGLEHSVALHTLIDFTLLYSTWLMRGGRPQTTVEDFLSLVPPIEIGYVFSY